MIIIIFFIKNLSFGTCRDIVIEKAVMLCYDSPRTIMLQISFFCLIKSPNIVINNVTA